MKTFMERVLAGEAMTGDIDDYVEAWHKEDKCVTDLADYLGLSAEEYSDWVVDPSAIERIVRKHRGISFHTLDGGASPRAEVAVYPSSIYLEQEVEFAETVREGCSRRVTVSLTDQQAKGLYELLRGIYGG